MALLVALEGIDGSGKGTQAQKLKQRLADEGFSTSLISFPRYEATLFGRAVGDFLNGRFGTLGQVHPFLASLLYAGDRLESREYLLETLRNHEVVVLDRYVPSNIAHQGAKVPTTERSDFVGRIRRIEYEINGLPPADLTVLLDLPAQAAQELIAKKKARSYTNKKADLQEADAGYLENVRNVYLDLASTEANWHRVECVKNGALRTVDDVAAEVWRAVSSKLRDAS